MDGFAVGAWIRALGTASRPCRVLVLSSGAMRGDAQRCREIGLDGYFPKPVVGSRNSMPRLGELLGQKQSAERPLPNCSPATSQRDRQPALDVLLVEDNPVNQQLALRLLEKWGHRVTLAANGQLALDAVEQKTFDVALMDMQMPVMSGIEATREIRRREAATGRPPLSIIAMTANAMQGDREACLDAGMNDYIAKPIKATDLAHKLGSIPAAARRGQNPAALAGHSAIDDLALADFDYAGALAAMDEDIVEVITPAFLEHFPQECAQLKAALAAADADAVHRLAHSMKGSLSVFGAGPATRRAGELEALARAGDLTNADAIARHLFGEASRLVHALETRAKDNG
jgi:two-component system sensor histidine kinase/response regulator